MKLSRYQRLIFYYIGQEILIKFPIMSYNVHLSLILIMKIFPLYLVIYFCNEELHDSLPLIAKRIFSIGGRL
jgi:hypothetical protein